jgi:hypothetical protein
MLKHLTFAEPLYASHGTPGFRGTPVEKHCGKILSNDNFCSTRQTGPKLPQVWQGGFHFFQKNKFCKETVVYKYCFLSR